jgi:hypothetical protein
MMMLQAVHIQVESAVPHWHLMFVAAAAAAVPVMKPE